MQLLKLKEFFDGNEKCYTENRSAENVCFTKGFLDQRNFCLCELLQVALAQSTAVHRNNKENHTSVSLL